MKNSYDYPEMYKELGLDMTELGCVMLDVDGSQIPKEIVIEDKLYYSPDPKKFWVNGFVAGDNPHISLLCGLLQEGPVWQKYIEELLIGWELKTIKIKDVAYFDSADPCYCIIAHIEITPELINGHERLQLLPHIDSFPGGYKPHLTLAYIKKDEVFRDIMIDFYKDRIIGMELQITGLNYGGKK